MRRLGYSLGSNSSGEFVFILEGEGVRVPAGVKIRESSRILNGRYPTGGGKVGDAVGLGGTRRIA